MFTVLVMLPNHLILCCPLHLSARQIWELGQLRVSEGENKIIFYFLTLGMLANFLNILYYFCTNNSMVYLHR